MAEQAVKTKPKKWLVGLLITLSILVLIPLALIVTLFGVNRFRLIVDVFGDTETEMTWGTAYEDQGAGARLVGTLFFKEGIQLDTPIVAEGVVKSSTPGTYSVTYRAEYYFWSGSAVRNVHVRDRQSPVITLVSNPDTYTIPGQPYEEEGYKAQDDCDGDITDRVIREEMDGVVTYRVSDQAGNETTVSRVIYYFDPVEPELTLVDGETVYLLAGEEYKEPGWIAMDNQDGDVSHRVTVEGTVDKYLAGSYVLTYTVTDSNGNVATAERTVVVQAHDRPDTVTPEGNVIYLTFDDGPGPYTEKLLRILAKYDVKATFFVVNSDYVHLIGDIVEQGHAVAIHSVSHTYREIYASPEAFFNDLLTMQQIIYEQSGVKTYLMRFPGGSSNTVSRFSPGIMTYLTQAVQDMGFCYFDWNVDSNDAGGAKDWEDVYENVKNGVQNRRISVVLQHDIKGFSVDAVEKLIIWALDNGYTFKAMDMTSPTSHHGVNN